MPVKIRNAVEHMIVRSYRKLTKSEKRIADYILRNPDEAAFLTSTKLAQRANVSEATVARFSTEIGCSGFADFQKILQNVLKEKLKPSEKLSQISKLYSNKAVHNAIFSTTIRNLKSTWENINPELLDAVTEKIIRANRIYIVGMRRSFSVAYALYYDLSNFSMNVILIDTSHGLLFDKVAAMKNDDVCITISFPRYASITYEILQHAKKAGCPIVAITDSLVSPIAQLADYVLPANYEVPSYSDSVVVALALTECIVANISRKREGSIKSMKAFERTLEEWNIWVVSEQSPKK
jgi:DNA-binding MurR/RpiR family transcriptional regulator